MQVLDLADKYLKTTVITLIITHGVKNMLIIEEQIENLSRKMKSK